MNIKSWLNGATKEQRKLVADKAKTTVDYMWQLSGEHRKAGPQLAIRIEVATQEVTPDRIVMRGDLRSDLWPAVA